MTERRLVGVRLPLKLIKQLKILTVDDQMSMQEIVERATEQYVNERREAIKRTG